MAYVADIMSGNKGHLLVFIDKQAAECMLEVAWNCAKNLAHMSNGKSEQACRLPLSTLCSLKLLRADCSLQADRSLRGIL